MERSVEMVVERWGTLKAGAAYLPLDGRHRTALEYMMKNAGSGCVAHAGEMLDKAAGTERK